MKKLTILFAVCVAVIFFTKSFGQAPEFSQAKVFFVDRHLHCLMSVTHKIPKDSAENQAKSVMEILSREQKSDSGFSTYITAADKIGVKVKGETAHIDLPRTIKIPDDRDNQKLFLYQIVNSLCSLSDIKYVRFTVDGKNCDEFFGFYKGKELFSPDYYI